MTKMLQFNNAVVMLFSIVAASLLLKNPFWDQPFIEHFGSYQSIVAMVAYEYAQKNFMNFFYPNSLILINGIPSLEMIYHPLCSFVAAVLWKWFGGSLDYWGRMQAMFFSGLAAILACLSAKLIGGKKFALWTAFFFAFSPMSLIYGRNFMNEPIALCCLISSFMFLQMWKQSSNCAFAAASGLLFSLVLVLRLHFIVALPAFLLFIILDKIKGRWSAVTLFTLLSFALTVPWFWHTYQVTMTYPNVHTSLFAQIEQRSIPDPLLFQPRFYEKVFLKEFLFRLWGPFVSLLVIGSLFFRFSKDKLWIGVFFLCTFGSVFLWPTKFYDHQFYFMPLIFPGALLAASIVVRMKDPTNKKKVVFALLVLIANVCLTLRPSFTQPPETTDFFEAVAFVQQHTDSNDKLMTSHGSSSDFLYYLRRYGHSFGISANRDELPKLHRSRSFSALAKEEMDARDKAFRNSVVWFEYIKKTNDLAYYIVVPKTDLEQDQALKNHLKERYSIMSDPDRNFVLYRLRESGRKEL